MKRLTAWKSGFVGVAAVLFLAVTSSCAVKSVREEKAESADSTLAPTGLEGEVSLKSDRSDLDALRKDVPEEIKKQNDEIAMILSFINRDGEEDPNRIRDRFSTALRKKRETVDKQVRRAREAFSKNEKKEREDFLKEMKVERGEYLGRKRSSDDRKRFFDDQEDKRKSFFADQSEKRKDFESRVQDERKALEDFVREKQNYFNQEWRGYQQRFTERKRQNDLKKRMEQKARDLERAGKPSLPVTSPVPQEGMAGDMPASAASFGVPSSSTPQGQTIQNATSLANDPLKEFDQIPAGPGVPLTPGKKGP